MYKRQILGDENICSITYKDLPMDLAPGARVLLDDGLIELVVDSIDEDDIVCVVKNGGHISNHKGVNVPGTKLSIPYMSAQDREDILFGIQTGFDFIAASFVSCLLYTSLLRRPGYCFSRSSYLWRYLQTAPILFRLHLSGPDSDRLFLPASLGL